MKNLIVFSVILCLCSFLQAQVKVISNGNVGIGITGDPSSLLGVGHVGSTAVKTFVYNTTTTGGPRAIHGYIKPGSPTFSYGVYGSVQDTLGGNKRCGVYGIAYRSSPQTTTRNFGVLGYAGNADDGFNYGVYGQIAGENNGAAIFGATPGYGDCDVGDVWAGYFNGKVYIDESLTVDETNYYSDINLKKDIRNLESGVISKLQQLHAVKYKRKHPTEIDGAQHSDTIDLNADINSEKYTKDRIGLIAQELQPTFPEVVKILHNGYLGVHYYQLIPILVEAIKEQQTMIENLENDISELISESSGNLKSGNILTNESLDNDVNTPILYHNTPNPFDEDTEIRFYIPEDVNSADLYIYNMQGNQISNSIIVQRGYGTKVISGSDLQPGMYLYTLIVNGLEVNTRRMILTD